jgi:hypothetical protein
LSPLKTLNDVTFITNSFELEISIGLDIKKDKIIENLYFNTNPDIPLWRNLIKEKLKL